MNAEFLEKLALQMQNKNITLLQNVVSVLFLHAKTKFKYKINKNTI